MCRLCCKSLFVVFALLLWLGPAVALPPLQEAARTGNLTELERLVSLNPSGIEDRDEDGNEAIHWAVANGHDAIVAFLLEHGVSPDAPKGEDARRNQQAGWTPLHQAAAGGQIECLRVLLEHRASLITRDQSDQTPLHTAVWHNQLEATKLLLDAGTPVNIPRKDKVIPLEIAAYFGHTEIVRLLLTRGGDYGWHVYEGNMPLHQAVRNGHMDVMQILVDAGADLNGRRDDGQTPLHVAAASGRVWETSFLLSMGADPNAKTVKGLTPLALAEQSNQAGTAAVLKAYRLASAEMTALLEARKLNQASLPRNLRETTVYQNAFDGDSPGREWSTTDAGTHSGTVRFTDIPNTGKRFLGDFGDQTVRLTLSKLPRHQSVTVVLTLAILSSWDGGGILGMSGPDIWEASVEGGPMLFRTTFANNPETWKHTPIQAFPGEYTREFHPGRTGALAQNVLHLGATTENPQGQMDAVYRLKFTFSHNRPSVSLNFRGRNLQELTDESWGIRAIEVRVGQSSGEGIANGAITKRKRPLR